MSGLFEAGFGPGIPYLLSFFYLRHELGFRIGIFLSAAPLATTFAGALAYGITSGHSHLANWRLLFLVEGLPTIFMAAVAYYFLPVSPDKARFLTQEEALVAKARVVRQVGDTARVGGIVWKDIGATLLDMKAWLTAVFPPCTTNFYTFYLMKSSTPLLRYLIQRSIELSISRPLDRIPFVAGEQMSLRSSTDR